MAECFLPLCPSSAVASSQVSASPPTPKRFPGALSGTWPACVVSLVLWDVPGAARALLGELCPGGLGTRSRRPTSTVSLLSAQARRALAPCLAAPVRQRCLAPLRLPVAAGPCQCEGAQPHRGRGKEPEVLELPALPPRER